MMLTVYLVYVHPKNVTTHSKIYISLKNSKTLILTDKLKLAFANPLLIGSAVDHFL